MKTLHAALIVIVLVLASCGTDGAKEVAQAEPRMPDNPACTGSANAHSILTGLQEHVSGRGIAPGGVVAALYTTRDGSTWSVLLVFPEGMSCLLIVGKEWQHITAPQNAL